MAGERDGWILVAARWPDLIREWIPGKLAELEDPRMVRLYRLLSEIGKATEATTTRGWRKPPTFWPTCSSRPTRPAEAQASEWASDDLPFDLLDAFAVESDPRMERMQQLMRERGWAGLDPAGAAGGAARLVSGQRPTAVDGGLVAASGICGQDGGWTCTRHPVAQALLAAGLRR